MRPFRPNVAWQSLALFAVFFIGRDSFADPPVRFTTDIRPIFNLHCVGCHGGVKAAGELKITDQSNVAKILEPGNANDSEIIERITTDDPDLRMPPPDHGPRLSSDDIESIKRWIDQGAKWELHWAFEPIKPLDMDSVADSSVSENVGVTSRVDSLWLQSLQQNKLAPSPSTSNDSWLRRATLAVTGLPPSLDAYREFNSDVEKRGEQAYEYAVDRLLTSPRYGEHWASVWLDQVRYADSRGLGQDGPRTMWKYRDWVIDALNSDMPFDEFTIKQLAGDLLPDSKLSDRIATAGHRLTQTNEEGGTDDEEFRIAAVIDRINTAWQVWHGTTFGCVQCHDHPYDPFRHDDYYQFMSYFNNTSDWDLNEEFPIVSVPLDRNDYERADDIERKMRSLQQSIWEREYMSVNTCRDWKPLSGMQVKSSNDTRIALDDNSAKNEFHTVGTVQKNTDYTIEWISEQDRTLSAFQITIKPQDAEKAARDSEWGAVLSYIGFEKQSVASKDWVPIEVERVVGDEPFPFHAPDESLNRKSNQGFGAYTRIMKDRKASFVLKSDLKIASGDKIRILVQHRYFILDAFPLVSKRVAIDYNDGTNLRNELAEKRLVDDRKQLRTLKDKLRAIPSTTVPVMGELVQHLQRPTHVFVRGLFLTKDKQVSSHVPSWLVKEFQSNPANRLGLAQWFVHPNNPLTSRVFVNRIWARLFGSGIVVTEEDFGSSGELPTHPLLLDDLAFRCQTEMQWSQKRLIRELILSKVFRQSSTASKEMLEKDPLNRFLARGPRVRMSAEVIRDVALEVAGLLDHTVGGPPVHPPIPDGVWTPFQGGDKWDTPAKGEQGRYRRSVYTYTKRSIPYPMFAAFDAPSREFCTSRRLISNTPVQALTTLNETTFTEAAEALGRQFELLEKNRNSTSLGNALTDQQRREQTIALGMQLITGRLPNSTESATLAQYFENREKSKDTATAWKELALLLLNHDELFSN